jgi:tRNA (cytidine/uridine-2'-O-)-methyltransferase
MKSRKDLHIVLVEPEIPQNTGNIGRTCVGLNAALHLVGELGFSLAERDLKRAGLDYWEKLDLRRHATWADFLMQIEQGARMHFFSTHGENYLWDRYFELPCYLIFGSESRGFPPSFYDTYKKDLVKIPISGEIRSLNLSTAVGVAAFEAVRQSNATHRL